MVSAKAAEVRTSDGEKATTRTRSWMVRPCIGAGRLLELAVSPVVSFVSATS